MYDQGSTLKALNFYEDFLILYETAPEISKYENPKQYKTRVNEYKVRRKNVEIGRQKMRETLAAGKVESGKYVEGRRQIFYDTLEGTGQSPAVQSLQ